MSKPWMDLPQAFRERLELLVPAEKLQEVYDTFSHPRPTTFRVNTLKSTAPVIEQVLNTSNIPYKKILWYSDAFIVPDTSPRQLSDLDIYKEGHIYVQNLSSMIPPLVLDPKPEEAILDLTAAPGSKTSQIAALMQNTGEIVANDNSRIRLYRLEANLKTLGITNTSTSHQPGQIVWQKYPEYFDRTLVDVPCNMEGRFQTSDPTTYEHWSTKKIKELLERQRFLLRSAVSATKPGGTIVYSTCTLAPEENEGVIDWILSRERGAVELEAIELPRLTTSPGITSWKTKTYDSSLQRSIRIYPNTIMEGFYVAKLRKTRSTTSHHSG